MSKVESFRKQGAQRQLTHSNEQRILKFRKMNFLEKNAKLEN